jgi:DNA-binding MarR family transcriptional regulator
MSDARNSDTRLAAELLLDVGPRLTRLIALAVETPASDPADSLTLAQARALRHLGRGPSLAGDLARRLGVSPATVSELVDTLVRRGLIERSVDADDRRQQPLRLTPAGERATEAAQGRAIAALVAIIGDQSNAEARALTHALDRLRVRLDECLPRCRADIARDGGAR